MTATPLTAERVRRFFEQYLFLDTEGREHVTVLFYDLALPHPFLEGLRGVGGTRLLAVDARQIRSQAEVLRQVYEPSRRYVSVHDYCARSIFTRAVSAAGFARVGHGIDYTSFEFPRFDLSDEQVVLLLERFTAGDPRRECAQAEAFYRLLGEDRGYCLEVRSGPALDRVLTVRGPSPWMEICGPLAEGDIRFAPGSELFYNGPDVDGTLHCAVAINLLPLRSDHVEEQTCRTLLELGQIIPDDPLDLEFTAGRLVGIRSRRPLAGEFLAVF